MLANSTILALTKRLTSELIRHAHTLFLFTKSDIKTTVIPIVSAIESMQLKAGT